MTQNGRWIWCFAALGIVVVLGGTILLWVTKFPPGKPKFFPLAVLGFAIVLVLAMVVGKVTEYTRLSSALRDSRCEVAEGKVVHFQPEPVDGKGSESFTVNGSRFQYSRFIDTTGFNRTRPAGGPLREGLQVRIHHVGNQIARLEIAR